MISAGVRSCYNQLLGDSVMAMYMRGKEALLWEDNFKIGVEDVCSWPGKQRCEAS